MNTKTRSYVVGAIAVIAVGVVVLIAMTSGPPPAEPEGDHGVGQERVGLQIRELTEEERVAIEAWRERGVLQELDTFTHEATVDSAGWDALTDDEQEELTRLVSLYFKSFDGTTQAKMLRADSGEIAADYFGDVIRLR
ncbi:MAG: hypothetical protein ACLFUA_04450 [Spirochaetales bacterium]